MAFSEQARAKRGYTKKRDIVAFAKASMPPREVTENAACGPDTATLFDIFAPAVDSEQAVAICAGCPVRVACAEWAQERNRRGDQHGVAGGIMWSNRRRSAA